MTNGRMVNTNHKHSAFILQWKAGMRKYNESRRGKDKEG